MTTPKKVQQVNGIDSVEKLAEALKSAPQEKEGTFRVATWNMVIERMLQIEKAVEQLANVDVSEQIKTAVSENVEAIKTEINNEISSSSADTILF